MSPPSLCAQLGSHERQMLKQAGITPIVSSIGRGWRNLDPVATDEDPQMRQDVLRELRKPATFAMLEGPLAAGFLWWDHGWVWERWHRLRWPVELVRGSLEDFAARTGVRMELVSDSYYDLTSSGAAK